MRTAPTDLSERDAVLMGALGLAGEAGEVADLVKKQIFTSTPLIAKSSSKSWVMLSGI